MQAQYQNQAPATIESLIREVFEGEDFYSFEVMYEDSSAVDVSGYGVFDKEIGEGLSAHVAFETGLDYTDGPDELTGRFSLGIEGPRFAYVHYEWFVSTAPGDEEMQDLMRLFPKAEECLKIAAAQVHSAILECPEDYTDEDAARAKMMLEALDPDGTLDY
jgi:hypothetical protein|nr:MAG TPA: hypothetical protein [Caudoviricetes sp.]